ncbi:MAG: hypothetical protein H8E98_06210 [Bacteroidetes bacterium]|nr:hypothetical protein [Bacteroidota bacterium]
MKKSEFRKLIKEEIRKILSEVAKKDKVIVQLAIDKSDKDATKILKTAFSILGQSKFIDHNTRGTDSNALRANVFLPWDNSILSKLKKVEKITSDVMYYTFSDEELDNSKGKREKKALMNGEV